MKMVVLVASAVALALVSLSAGNAAAQSKSTSGKVEYLRAAGSEPALSAPRAAAGGQITAKRSRKKK